MNFNARKRSSGIDGWTIILCIIVAVVLIQTGIVKP
jgi:hypothetical protein